MSGEVLIIRPIQIRWSLTKTQLMSSSRRYRCHQFMTAMFFNNTNLVNNAKSLVRYNSTALKNNLEKKVFLLQQWCRALKRRCFYYSTGVASLALEAGRDALFPVFLYRDRRVVAWLKRLPLSQIVPFKPWPWAGHWDDWDTQQPEGHKFLPTW